MTDIGLVRRTPLRVGSPPVMTETASLKAIGRVIEVGLTTIIVGTATVTTILVATMVVASYR